jgi:hypothetical protein
MARLADGYAGECQTASMGNVVKDDVGVMRRSTTIRDVRERYQPAELLLQYGRPRRDRVLNRCQVLRVGIARRQDCDRQIAVIPPEVPRSGGDRGDDVDAVSIGFRKRPMTKSVFMGSPHLRSQRRIGTRKTPGPSKSRLDRIDSQSNRSSRRHAAGVPETRVAARAKCHEVRGVVCSAPPPLRHLCFPRRHRRLFAMLVLIRSRASLDGSRLSTRGETTRPGYSRFGVARHCASQTSM